MLWKSKKIRELEAENERLRELIDGERADHWQAFMTISEVCDIYVKALKEIAALSRGKGVGVKTGIKVTADSAIERGQRMVGERFQSEAARERVK